MLQVSRRNGSLTKTFLNIWTCLATIVVDCSLEKIFGHSRRKKNFLRKEKTSMIWKIKNLDTSCPGVTSIVTFCEGPPSVSQTQWGTCHIGSQYVSKIHNIKFLLWYSNCKRSTLNSDQLLYIFAFPSTIISSSSGKITFYWNNRLIF